MKKMRTRLIAWLSTVSMLLCMLATTGFLSAFAEDTVQVFQDFEKGTEGFGAWMVDGNATWGAETAAPLAGKTSLRLSTANAAGCYVTFPAAIGVKDIALRLKVTGNTGIVRVVANGEGTHAHDANGFQELTTSQFVFTDVNGTVLTDVASYDAPWGGLRFAADFDGYVFIKNENNVDIQKINVGIFHGSTNAEGMTLLFDDFATYSGTDYAAVVEEIRNFTPVVLIQDFEKGTEGFGAWMVDGNATWGTETAAPLAGMASLKLSTANAAGCYVTFPAAVGAKNIALRLKVMGNTGIVRVVANGESTHAHDANAFQELTTSQFVFTDVNGTVLENVASYDEPWGGLRFGADFDGYVFIKNENNVDIQRINLGIFHGSTNAEGMTLLFDNFAAYNGTDYASIVDIIKEESTIPAVMVQDFEKGTEGFGAWMTGSDATWGTDSVAPVSGMTSLKLSTANAVGSYVSFPAAIGTKDIALRLKVEGNTGIVRVVANGGSNHAHGGYQELTTSQFVFTDVNGNVLENVASYDAPWGGLRFGADFDGYLFIKNENNIDIQEINVGIYHGSTNDKVTLWFDDFVIYSGTNYGKVVDAIKAMATAPALIKSEEFENGTDGFTYWMVDGNATWGLEKLDHLSGTASLKLSTSNAAGCYVNFPAAIGKFNIGFRLKVTGMQGILRVGANGNDAHNKRADAETGYEELTTESFVFLDAEGNVLADAAEYDAAWGGIRFKQAFDGYVLMKNDNQVDIQKINVAIFHGSTNAEGMTLLFDNFFICNTTDYKLIARSFEAPVSAVIAQKVQGFENGSDGFTSWLPDANNASWELDTNAPLCSTTSLKLHSVNGAGSYVNFPAAIGVKNIALRLKVTGNNGIVRIGANGNDAHNADGYNQLTTSAFVFTDTAGNVLENVAVYDADWGGLRFVADFNGYVFIKNENNVDIQKINVAIFHGSTNADGMTLLVDNVFTYEIEDYARVLGEMDEQPILAGEGVLQNFENGIDGFTSWLVDSNATWQLEKKSPLAGTASLKLSTANAAGCYVTFPGKAGSASLAVRVKVFGLTGVIRIGANGNDAHYKSSENANGYHELTTEDIVFTDVNGNVLEDAGYYDAPWGGIRFNGEFDGYIFLRNQNKVDIQKINVGIFHGSTNENGFSVVFDNFRAYKDHTPENFAAIAAELNLDVPVITLAAGVSGVPNGTKDELISDDFEADSLNADKWQGTGTMAGGAVQIPAEGILSVYGQKATVDKPALFNASYDAATNGAGMALYSDDTHYLKVYYEDGAWYYAACAGAAETKELLVEKTFAKGNSTAIVYNGAQATLYINDVKIKEIALPEGWDADRQYKVKLLGESAVSDLYVAGGVFTYTGKDASMSDDFNGDAFDADKWSVANIGYYMGDASLNHPGTLKPELKDGYLVVSGQPDAAGSWAGITLYTTETQSPSVYNSVSFEVTRVSSIFQEMNPPAVASGIGIYVDEQNFFQFALNSWSPTKWQWAGKVNGTHFVGEVHSSGSTNTTAYRFKIVYDGKEVQCYVDGYLVATVKFDVKGVNVHGSLLVSPSNPPQEGSTDCEIAVTYEDFVTTGLVANAVSTAEEQAATITGIQQPTRRDKQVILPQVAPGFKATLVNMQPAGYLDENGVILKRDNKDVTVKAQVKVYDERNDRYVLTEAMDILLQKAYTPAIVQDELANGELPNQILGGKVVKGLQNPFIDETRLHLPCTAYEWTSPDNDISCPELPEGFVSELVDSSDKKVITLDGKVIPPAKETVVTLKLKITQESNGASETRSYTVTVPAASGHAEWDGYKDNKVGMFLHYFNGQLFDDGSATLNANEAADAFDVQGVVESAVKWKVDYIQLTAWHGDLITLYPSEVQKAYGLTAHGEPRYTERDVIGDLLDALDAANKEYGTNIELYLYTHPGQGVALHAIDQESVGWGDYDAYNTYLAELYYELVSRFTNRENGKMGISGLYFDEGSPKGDMDLYIDYPRLRDACKRAYSDLVMIQNLYQGNLYSQDVANHEVWPGAGTPYSSSFRTEDVTAWEAHSNGGYSIVLAGGWNPSSAVSDKSVVTSQYTLSNMFKYTVLLASVNTEGGGVAWSFGNYAQSANSTQLWETGIDETMTAFAEYYAKYRESLYGTVPGKAYVTANANGVTSMKRILLTDENAWGVSTDSKDGKTTYLHVLFAPQGNVLELAAPANGVTFSSARLIGAEGAIEMAKTADGGYRLTLPADFQWDEIDTVIALTAGDDSKMENVEDEKVEIDFATNPVLLKDDKAYILEGTTYETMKEYLEKDGLYFASFLSADGLDEIDDTSAQWTKAAEEGMILRLFTADYSEMADYVITYYVEEAPSDDENVSSPETGDTSWWLFALVLGLLSGAAAILLSSRKERSC